jgi:hypothetical protein
MVMSLIGDSLRKDMKKTLIKRFLLKILRGLEIIATLVLLAILLVFMGVVALWDMAWG